MNTSKITLAIIALFAFVLLGFWFYPQYNVFLQRKKAQADTIRAHGIARSNQIIGQSLTPSYLHWFFIDNLNKSNNVILCPTEANFPIMEATKYYNKQRIDSLKYFK